jgi:glycosyltransferase involved in cell wall biosynthesis
MNASMKVIHCLRAPVGGLFRHVCDLVAGQAARGFEIGVVCDARQDEQLFESALNKLARHCGLGVHRFPMHRRIAASDVSTAIAIRQKCRALDADVIHGHGAKGGAFARFAALGGGQRTFYTPHGGSLHYAKSSASGFVFLTMERLLARHTDGLIFESEFGLETYLQKVGRPGCEARVIHNGLREEEFAPVTAAPDAADFLFIGELRTLKGIETLLRALALVRQGRGTTAVIVGSGPDARAFQELAGELGIASGVRFVGPMPARQAFALGGTLIVPSLAESFPYIVLEALAAGKPTIATNVGGIPEMFGSHADLLVPPGDHAALATAMSDTLASPRSHDAVSLELKKTVQKRFTVGRMVAAVCGFYEDCNAPSGATLGPISGHRSPAK